MSMPTPAPGLGWDARRWVQAEAEVVASGQYCTPAAAPDTPLPKAWSLTGYRQRPLDQKGAGTCWVHSPTMMAEILANFKGYPRYDICRTLIGWHASQKYGGGHNQSQGGCPIDAVRAICQGGCGIAHEDAYPYSDNPAYLGKRPPETVWDDASDTSLVAPVIIKDYTHAKHLVLNGCGICTGIPWPGNWEEPKTFHSTRGRIVGGHSELMVGWADKNVFDKYEWVEMENWRNCPYPALSPELAKMVEGYESVKPGFTNSHWILAETFKDLIRGQIVEFTSAADYATLEQGLVDPAPGFGTGDWI